MPSRKGVVLEKGEGWAIILMPDGEYKKIKTNAYLEIGDLYQEKTGLTIKYAAVAAILLAMLLGTIDYYSVQAYAQVSSLAELGVNRWGRVITVQVIDNEAQREVDIKNIQNDKLEVAVEKICSQALNDEQKSEELISKPELTVVPKGRAEPQLKDKLLKKMEYGLQKARQTQEQQDEMKKSIKGKKPPISPLPKDAELPMQGLGQGNIKWDQENIKLNQDEIKKEMIKKKIEDMDQPTKQIEPVIKDHIDLNHPPVDLSDPPELFNHDNIRSDLENDIAKEKDRIKKKYIDEDRSK